MQHNPQACSTCEGCCVQENYAHNVLWWQRQVEVLVHGYIEVRPTRSSTSFNMAAAVKGATLSMPLSPAQ